MIIIFLRTVFIYILVIFTIRIMGKRQIGQLQPSEFVITILISNIATMAIEDVTIPLFSGIIPILVFMSFDIISADLSLKSKGFRNIVSGSPKIVIRNGVIDQKQLKELRFSVEDLFEELRANNVFDLNEVLFAIVETNGTLSLYKKAMFQNPTNASFNFNEKDSEPPILVVSNGDILEDNIVAAGISEEEIVRYLNKKKIRLSEVFILTCKEKSKFNLVKVAKK